MKEEKKNTSEEEISQEEKKKREEEKKKKEEKKKRKDEGKDKKEEVKEKEKERKGESSGNNEAVEVVDKAIELDEEIQKRRLTLLNLAMQDIKAMDICEKEGINPRDTFRAHIREEEGKKRLRLVTLGEEGEKKAKEMIHALGDSNEWHVKNEGVSRVEWGDIHMKETDDEPIIKPIRRLRERTRKWREFFD